MKTVFILLAIGTFCTTPVLALREGPPPTTAELVARSPWIFAGRVVRSEKLQGAMIGAVDVKCTVLAGLPLYGKPPKTVVLVGSLTKYPTVGKVYIFFAGPLGFQYPGIDGAIHNFRPYASPDIKELQALIQKLPASK